jgi:hypothetical protein
MENITVDNNEQQDVTVDVCQCACQGECQCGNKYKRIRPVYYEVDVNQIIESLNDWD